MASELFVQDRRYAVYTGVAHGKHVVRNDDERSMEPTHKSTSLVVNPFIVRAAACGLFLSVLALAPGPEPVLAQGAYQVVTVTDGATLSGHAFFRGEVPAARRLLVTKDEEVCGFGYRERRDVVVGDAGELQGAVVFVEGVTEGKGWPDADEHHMVDQKDCMFQPHVQVVPRWADMDIVNSDPVLHNIHAWELMGDRGRTLFNLGQPPEKEVITQAVRPRRGNQIRLECDAHDFMQGWIFAADSPYAVVTGADGTYRIDGIPPGAYTLKIWHPFLGLQERSVTLGAGRSGEVEFDFTGS